MAVIYSPTWFNPGDTNLGAGSSATPANADSGYDWLTGAASSGTGSSLTAYQKAMLDLKAAENARLGAGGQNAYNYTVDLLNAARQPFAGALEEINKQEETQRGFVQEQQTNLLKQIADRLAQSQAVTTAGYGNLRAALEQNAPRAFQEAQGAMPTITQNALGQYMQAQGASPAAVQPELNRLNAAAAGSAANYNSLLNVLRGAEQAGQASRLAEAQMAGNLAQQQLQAIYGTQTAGVERGALEALANIAAQSSAARIAAENARRQRAEALENALASLLARGFVSNPVPPPGSQTTTQPPTTTRTDSTTSTTPAPTTTTLTPEQVATATANLAAAGMSPATISTILNQNIGNPLVPGGIPDYLRVIQEQTSSPRAVAQAQAQAAQAVLNALAPVEVNAPQPLINLNPVAVEELAALIAQAQNAPGYGGGGGGGGGVFGSEAVMF